MRKLWLKYDTPEAKKRREFQSLYEEVKFEIEVGRAKGGINLKKVNQLILKMATIAEEFPYLRKHVSYIRRLKRHGYLREPFEGVVGYRRM